MPFYSFYVLEWVLKKGRWMWKNYWGEKYFPVYAVQGGWF